VRRLLPLFNRKKRVSQTCPLSFMLYPYAFVDPLDLLPREMWSSPFDKNKLCDPPVEGLTPRVSPFLQTPHFIWLLFFPPRSQHEISVCGQHTFSPKPPPTQNQSSAPPTHLVKSIFCPTSFPDGIYYPNIRNYLFETPCSSFYCS